MFKKVELWVVLLLVIVGFGATVLFGALLRYHESGGPHYKALGAAALFLSDVPINFIKSFDPSVVNESFIKMDEAVLQAKASVHYKKSSLLRFNNDGNIDGYFLVSVYDPALGTASIKLVDLKKGEVVHEWNPNVEEINQKLVTHRAPPKLFRSQHPYLTSDGGVVFSEGEGALVKLGACGNIDWVTDRQFHHSIEPAGDGTILVPVVVEDSSYLNKYISNLDKSFTIRDDGIGVVSLATGKVEREYSITKILLENGYKNLVVTALSHGDDDIIHLNDAEPIRVTDDYVRAGDVMLSSRHLSLIALYRPSTNKILWKQTGPWSQQHDIDYIGHGKFLIFGNDSLDGRRLRRYSSIYEYDMKSGKARPLVTLDKVKVAADSEGRSQLLSEDSLYVSDNQLIQIIDLNQERKLSMYFTADDKYALALHWARFLGKDTPGIEKALKAACN